MKIPLNPFKRPTNAFLTFLGRSHVTVEQLERLIKAGADLASVNSEGQQALHWVCFQGRADLAQVLLHHGASVNAQDRCGRTPLHLACMGDHLDCVKVLMNQGANPNLADRLQTTAFHCASSIEFFAPQLCQSFLFLLHHPGVDLEAVTASGETPLDVLNRHSHHHLAGLLKTRLEALALEKTLQNATNEDALETRNSLRL